MAERIKNHFFEVKANKIEQFIRNIPDYAGSMHAASSDAPGYIQDCEQNVKKHHSEWMKIYTGMVRDNYRQAVIFANKKTRELRS